MMVRLLTAIFIVPPVAILLAILGSLFTFYKVFEGLFFCLEAIFAKKDCSCQKQKHQKHEKNSSGFDWLSVASTFIKPKNNGKEKIKPERSETLN